MLGSQNMTNRTDHSLCGDAAVVVAVGKVVVDLISEIETFGDDDRYRM